MDINDARVATTVLGLVLFIGVIVRTWSKRNRRGFDEAAMLPFSDSAAAAEPAQSAGEKK
ncbi:MAG: cbb3-type cytochrome c oxidase subunit 3 [Rubrivivax sp.]|nr:cbb3-type cytochrome c oxidase subunit 3 [Rubrivivax sp.]MBK8528421.1 cbb3-type cytochrome c oxidase subunit 3 [Rubrivivax sp.]HRA63154.1 cbb3-type cytochrome c oxidase subunit 3 [Burkholderiaceae bacterium]